MRLLRKHMPELDVVRGVAILMVVLYHGLYWSGYKAPVGTFTHLVLQLSAFGWLGVNLFFVLSGFLITGILLDSKQRPMYYRRFYQRRALRILPAYLAILAVPFFLGHIDLKLTAVCLLFLTNYASALGVAVPYGPLWSLAVEEQFYLVWPMIVRKTSVRSLTVIACALCVVEPALRGFTAFGVVDLGNVHEATYLIADNLALGVLAAIFARSRYATLRNGIKVGLAVMGAGTILLLAGIPFGILHRNNPIGNSLQAVPWNLMFAGILLLLLGLRSPFFSGPWMAPLRFLGYISYGLYLVHLLAFNGYEWLVAKVPSPSLQIRLTGPFLRMALEGALAILLAWLSRRFYEEPFLRVKVAVPPASQTLRPAVTP